MYYRKLQYTFLQNKGFIDLFVCFKISFLLHGWEKVWGKILIVFSFHEISKEYKYSLVVFLLAWTELAYSASPWLPVSWLLPSFGPPCALRHGVGHLAQLWLATWHIC